MEKRTLKKKEFDLIYRKGKSFNGRSFSLKVLAQKYLSGSTRFGIVLGLKISKKAVVRNKKKRQLKEIARKMKSQLKSGFLVSVIAKPEIVNTEYQELNKEFLCLCQKAGLLKC